jgi:hypothetical protein
LERAEDWPRLHAIRNRFAHANPDDPERNASVLNIAIEAADRLRAILARIEQRLDLDAVAANDF